MTEMDCSFCEETKPCRVEFLHASWTEYLQEQTELFAAWSWKVAVCMDCYQDFALYHTQYGYAPNHPEDDEEVKELLDSINHLHKPFEHE